MARILIIDDDVQIRQMLEQMLTKEGYETISAPNGEVAMKLFRQHPAHVVLTDIIMPEKEGIETIMELKQQYPDVKIIAMSGGGRISPQHYLRMAKGLGAVHTFIKPIRRNELLDVLQELVEES